MAAIVSIRPALEAPVSKGHLCVKGRYAYNYISATDRITEPMIREKGNWTQASWQEAIDFSAAELKRILSQYGPQSVGVLGSARATNEENYLAQKFARAVLATNNVDCCARVCHAPTAAAMKMVLGTGAATNSLDDIERARTILLCGTNTTENHPIVGARIKEQVLRGANLVVIDPRRIELCRYAQVHLALRPGTNIALLNALAHVIIAEQLFDQRFVQERVSEFDEFREFIAAWPPERAAAICGVDADLIRNAARLYAGEKPSMCFHGLGVTEHTQGTDGVMTLVNLALLTGNLGQPGSGINPLRGQNNVQGSAHMGCEPDNLTGYVPLPENKALFESVWQAAVPTEKGLNLMQMMDAAAQGRFKALWAIGYDVLLTNANTASTRRGLSAMELVIVQDMFLNETARDYATVFLPAASAFEKDGTFMNGERRIQRVRKVIAPPGSAKSDWEIIGAMAGAWGKAICSTTSLPRRFGTKCGGFGKRGAASAMTGSIKQGSSGPAPRMTIPEHKSCTARAFPSARKPRLRRIPYQATLEVATEEFPFLLTTGRTLYQFNAGTMTLRTHNKELHPADFLDMAPEDAERLELHDGEKVRLRSRYGNANLPVRINSAVKQGELFATFHTAEVFLNNVTSPYRDRYVLAPEYKVTAVRIDKIP